MLTYQSINHNISNISDDQSFKMVETVHQIIKDLLIPITSAIGILLNIILLTKIVLFRFHRIFYKYLFAKTLCDLLHLMCGLAFKFRVCFFCGELSTYFLQIFSLYFFLIPFRMLSFISLFIQIFFNLNRYKKLKLDRNSIFINARSQFIFMAIFFISFITASPSLVALDIIEVKVDNKSEPLYYSVYKNTLVNTVYLGSLFVLEFLIPITVLIYLGKLVKESYNRRKNITIKRKEIFYTKIVMTLTDMCVVFSFIDFSCSIIPRISHLTPSLRKFELFKLIVDTLRISVYLLKFFLISIDTLIVFYFDRKLNKKKKMETIQ